MRSTQRLLVDVAWKRLFLCLGVLGLGSALGWIFVPATVLEREVTASMSQSVRTLKSIFDYELQNRAVGYATTQKLKVSHRDSVDGQFWFAFAALESFSQCVYAPFADKYELSMAPGLRGKIVSSLSTLLFRLPPEYYGRIVARAADGHVDRLRPLLELAPEEDLGFFRYVVAQEIVQVKASTELAAGQPAQAAETLRSFVAEQAEASFHRCGSR